MKNSLLNFKTYSLRFHKTREFINIPLVAVPLRYFFSKRYKNCFAWQARERFGKKGVNGSAPKNYDIFEFESFENFQLFVQNIYWIKISRRQNVIFYSNALDVVEYNFWTVNNVFLDNSRDEDIQRACIVAVFYISCIMKRVDCAVICWRIFPSWASIRIRIGFSLGIVFFSSCKTLKRWHSLFRDRR